MGVRLNKVLSELNIGFETAVEFLKKKTNLGEIKDDATPNTKISDGQYEALVNEFNTDKAVKTKAEQLFTKKVKEKKVEKHNQLIDRMYKRSYRRTAGASSAVQGCGQD